MQTPADACDCHLHIYDDRFAVAPTATSKPPHAPVAAYRQVQAELGLSRAVVVQPTAYGFDNACTLDAVAALGSSARGVVVVPPDCPAHELERLDRSGVRGVRFQMLGTPLLAWESLPKMAARIAQHGWHVQVQFDGRELPQHEAMLRSLDSRLVIDHTGKFLEPVTREHEGFRALLRLLDAGNCWVKLSAPYETSRTGAPRYEDVGVLARALIETHPERCLWGSNWPHPNASPVPSSATLLALLYDWAGDDATRIRILTDNPAELYGF